MEQRTVSLTATIALSIVTLIIGFFAGMVATNPNDATSVLSSMTESTNDKGDAADSAAAANAQSGANAAAPAGADTPAGSEVAFTLSTDRLSEAQRSMLTTMGIEETEIAITYDMIACAEAKIGADRVTAIKNGASPSFTEGAQLLACYN